MHVIDRLDAAVIGVAFASFGALGASRCATPHRIDTRPQGVYVLPQGEAMECLGAARSSCGWTYNGCGEGRVSFRCMPEPEIN